MRFLFYALGWLAVSIGVFTTTATSQVCPPNIDFENGNFDGWKCYAGSTAALDARNVITLTETGPLPGRHTMYDAVPGDGVDPYGGFPVNCPNGSGHSIRLGNDQGGGQAEGISYEFTIPPGQNNYTLIYYYAVVFQQPRHAIFQQPRMEIEITNVSDQTTIDCASFTFIAFGSSLPGFQTFVNPVDTIPVLYKDWTAVSIDLSGNAGKKIRLFFKTADCTFQRHFGYGYIDINSECDGKITGASYCPDDTAINVIAPYGYDKYTWYDSTRTNVLGNQQVLTLSPPPPPGTVLSVKLEPYYGYGCPQTLLVELNDSLQVKANAGADKLSCNRKAVQIGSLPKAGLVYSWSPAAGLSNPDIANPLANPVNTTSYILTVRNSGGGCMVKDTVVVTASALNDSLQLLGKDMYCIGSGDSAVLKVFASGNIQWYKNDAQIAGANNAVYRVAESGTYYALLRNSDGCVLPTPKKAINISTVPEAAFSINTANQCLVGNKYIFTNNSTNEVGGMQYLWNLGDNIYITPAKDVPYSYLTAGVFNVQLIVRSSPVCVDSVEKSVQVYQNAIADFTIKPTCINLPVQITNNTVDTIASPINYIWNFGNGQMSNVRNPGAPVFPVGGNFTMSLSVNTDQCPFPYNTLKKVLAIDKPLPGINYPLKYALIDFPFKLQARNFGINAYWTPATNLSSPAIYNPIFTGKSEQLYTIEITTSTGCITVDTQLVKTVKDVMIFVPSAFTPNGDGKNDLLRPILMGIDHIRYFRIFNRWGQQVHQTTSELPGWNGMVNGIAQGTQTYVWIIDAIGVDGKVYTRKGTSVLLR